MENSKIEKSKGMENKNGLLILLFLVIIGSAAAFSYNLKQQKDSTDIFQVANPVQIKKDSATEQIKVQNTSDEVDSIETDLKATNIDAIDQ